MARDERAHLIPTGSLGLFGRGEAALKVREGVGHAIDGLRRSNCEVIAFPPVMRYDDLLRSGYFSSFPQLVARLRSLPENGPVEAVMTADDPGDLWSAHAADTELVLAPAACYHVYPLMARRGDRADRPILVDVRCECFRREPSLEADRMQSFAMREFVCIGDQAAVVAFRQEMLRSTEELMMALGLETRTVVAHDPFFGRLGKLLMKAQVETEAKFEIVDTRGRGIAIVSANYHERKFGKAWGLLADGEAAHSACIGFGIDRIAAALARRYEEGPGRWPANVRKLLQL